jgi:arsenate reductase
MKEAGLDISDHESTKVTDAMLEHADLVVTVCGHADESCPILPPGTLKEHWPLEDPEKATGSEDELIDIFRATRDDIKQRVKKLLQQYSQSE